MDIDTSDKLWFYASANNVKELINFANKYNISKDDFVTFFERSDGRMYLIYQGNKS